MARNKENGGSADRVCVGAIAGAFSVRGEARIKSFTDDPAAIGDYGPVQDETGQKLFDVQVTRGLKGGFLAARLSGVENREAAAALTGVQLFVPRQALPVPQNAEEFYHADLVGLAVFDRRGKRLGMVKAVLNHGAGDILEVARPEGGEPALLPFTQAAVPTIDVADNRLIADPPEGVFERDTE